MDRGKHITPNQREWVKFLRNQGLSYAKVADRLKISIIACKRAISHWNATAHQWIRLGRRRSENQRLESTESFIVYRKLIDLRPPFKFIKNYEVIRALIWVSEQSDVAWTSLDSWVEFPGRSRLFLLSRFGVCDAKSSHGCHDWRSRLGYDWSRLKRGRS